MKRTIIMLLMLIACFSASAQTGLRINELFLGRIIPNERMIDTRVRGKTLEKYRLTFYRSLRMNVSNDENRKLHQLLDSDISQSIDMRSHRENPHSWKTYTCKLQMRPYENKNRYLCYQEQWNSQHDKCEVTVIYMEGTVGSLDELEQLLK